MSHDARKARMLKRSCDTCKENKEIGHLFYMRLLKDALPPAGDKVLYVFYDLETSKNTEYADEAELHVPNLVSVQLFCSPCDDAEDACDCVRCDTRRLSFLQYPVGDILS